MHEGAHYVVGRSEAKTGRLRQSLHGQGTRRIGHHVHQLHSSLDRGNEGLLPFHCRRRPRHQNSRWRRNVGRVPMVARQWLGVVD